MAAQLQARVGVVGEVVVRQGQGALDSESDILG
jgi:hypothetical protein